jgi:uncharacterized protein (TIGR02453 family)
VQGPALRFIAEMGARLARISSHVVADHRPFGGSLSRIYRDTRFSKDKSPYKTGIGIHFAHNLQSKGSNLPGFYLHIAPEESMVAAGIWRPDPPALRKIRDAMVKSPAAWRKVLARGIEMGGESYVRVPSGYDPAHPLSDDLRRKDFYGSKSLTDSTVSSSGFGEEFTATCRDLDPLNQFLAEAIGVPW